METTCFRLFLSLLLFLVAFTSQSQDVMILKSGDEIKAKVIEVTPDVVKYKKWDNQDGPIYSSNKADVFMIKYQNGSKDVFNSTQEENKPKSPSDNTSAITGIAKAYMEQQVSSQSNGKLRLIDFKKQNGVINESFGPKTYTLEYVLVIEAMGQFWKKTEDKFMGANWYWTNFTVLDQGSKGGWDDYNNNWASFDRGSKIEITGTLSFENTENGWRVTGVNMFSRGYKNKSSKILPNTYNNTPPPPPPPPIEDSKPIIISDSNNLSEVANGYFKSKQYNKAIEVYQLNIKLKKAPPVDYYNLGKVYFSVKNYKMADSILLVYNDLNPDNPLGYLWRARALTMLDPDSKAGLAYPVYETFISKTEQNTEKYSKDLIEAYYYCSYYNFLQFNAGKDQEKGKLAIEYAKKTIALDPNNEKANTIIKMLKKKVKD